MNDQYYLDQMKVVQALNEKHLDGMSDILRTFLGLQSTLFAVLSALLPAKSQAIAPRVLLLGVLVSLLGGSLTSLIALYDLRDYPRRAKEALLDEVRCALREDRRLRYIPIEPRQRTHSLVYASAFSFSLALVCLLAYAVLFLFVS